MRINQLDFLKWLAIVFMVLDHLRFLDLVEPVRWMLFLVGRFAFPIFCFILAYNFFRTENAWDNKKSDLRYISSLLIFFLLSELPYRLYSEMEATSMNIMLTLSLSFMLLYAFARHTKSLLLEPSFVCLSVVILVFGLEYTDYFKIQYGIGGVFLPLAMYLALKEPTARNMMWVAICAGYMNLYLNGGSIFNSMLNFISAVLPVLMSIIGALAPFAIIKAPMTLQLPPIKKWGYYFYPAHLSILEISRVLYRFFT